jgi:hypothetical protein
MIAAELHCGPATKRQPKLKRWCWSCGGNTCAGVRRPGDGAQEAAAGAAVNAIRRDNGAPFAARTQGGLSRLPLWWMKLGIRPERIAAGHPE